MKQSFGRIDSKQDHHLANGDDIAEAMRPAIRVVPSDRRPELLDRAMQCYAERRIRDAHFGDHSSVFGEPAWDMLLDIFIATERGRRLSVGAACIGAMINQTSGLRLIGILESQGLLVRTIDPLDARRRFVHLTDKSRELITAYLSR